MSAPPGGPSFSRLPCCRLARHPNPLTTMRPPRPRVACSAIISPAASPSPKANSQTAANDLLKALAQSPSDQELTLQAFIASLDAGRPEAVKLARQLPDSQVAQLVLADVDIKAGHWQAAEQRFQDLPRQGLTQLLQPLLVAWAQQGDGRTDTALSTLRPVCRKPAVPHHLRPARGDDRRPRRPQGRGRQAVSRRRDRSVGAQSPAWRRSWRAGRPAPASRRKRSASWHPCPRSRRTWRSPCRV